MSSARLFAHQLICFITSWWAWCYTLIWLRNLVRCGSKALKKTTRTHAGNNWDYKLNGCLQTRSQQAICRRRTIWLRLFTTELSVSNWTILSDRFKILKFPRFYAASSSIINCNFWSLQSACGFQTHFDSSGCDSFASVSETAQTLPKRIKIIFLIFLVWKINIGRYL